MFKRKFFYGKTKYTGVFECHLNAVLSINSYLNHSLCSKICGNFSHEENPIQHVFFQAYNHLFLLFN